MHKFMYIHVIARTEKDSNSKRDSNSNKRNQKLINVAQFFLLSDNIARTHLLILLFYDKVIKQQCSITHGSFKGLCFVSALAETASRSQDLCC